MNRKLWSNEEKVSAVLGTLRRDESAASICTRHGMSVTQAYRWLDRLLESGHNSLY
jgi:transposase-like protein